MSDTPPEATSPDAHDDEPKIEGWFLLDYYMQQRRIGVMVIAVGLTLLTAWFVVRTMLRPAPPELDYSKIGIHLLLDDGRNQWEPELWETHIQYAAQITSTNGIAVQVVRGDDLDPQRWQQFLDLANEYDLTPVLRLATTFDHENKVWTAPSPPYTDWATRYADFLNALDWHDDSKHIILLNEPNNGHEWGGRPDPAAYADFLFTVGTQLKTDVEGLVLLNAALDLYAPDTGDAPFPNSDLYHVDADTFMEEMVAAQADVFSVVDVWNSHAYPPNFSASPAEQSFGFDALNNAPDDAATPPDGVFNRGINGYTWELWKLSRLGVSVDDLGVMITETGWRHAESSVANLLDSGTYPTVDTLRRYVDLAMRGQRSGFATGRITWQAWLADERVIAVAPFALNGVPSEWGHTNWLILDENGTVQDVYPMFDMVASYPLRD